MPFVSELLNFVSDVFVETGTFQGDTIYTVANNDICKPSKVISLELSDVFFNNCKKRFENNSSVILYKGNSKYDLYDIIKDIPTKITFWLDGHWSGTPDVGSDPITICPVLEELEQIKNHKLNTHTIMIDNVRLMINTDNRYDGFPVTKDQILTKLYEINPNYIIKYFDDYTAINDVLVAYVEEKQCVHKYLTKCSTNSQPPGFSDFLRGTIALYNFSKMYNYKLFIDCQHPLFNFLKPNKNIIYSNINSKVDELIPPLSYEDIYLKLNDNFNSGKPLTVITNSFYNLQGNILSNFGQISDDCADYIKDILSPSIEVENKLNFVFSSIYKINMNDSFKVIHLRFGDKYIHENIFDDVIYRQYYSKIYSIINQNKNEKYILISDSSEMAKKLKIDIPELFYWDNSKIHLGDLINIENSKILDTMVDFFIISRSKEIISNGSGFSHINSVIYNIKYRQEL
jgi:hypothetical protein